MYSVAKGMTPFLKKQYIAHARHKGNAPENSILLYEYVVESLGYGIIEGDVVFTKDGVGILNHSIFLEAYINKEKISVDVTKAYYDELRSYSLSCEDYIPITTVEEFIKFGKSKDVWIMLDLTFQKYSYSNYKYLYNLACKYDMKQRIIWGDPDFFKLAMIDRKLICQLGGSWGCKMLIEAAFKSLLCKKMIMSFSYYGGDIEQFEKIVRYGHRLGFVMKVATVNDAETANRFWKIGTDLINTDALLNEMIE